MRLISISNLTENRRLRPIVSAQDLQHYLHKAVQPQCGWQPSTILGGTRQVQDLPGGFHGCLPPPRATFPPLRPARSFDCTPTEDFDHVKTKMKEAHVGDKQPHSFSSRHGPWSMHPPVTGHWNLDLVELSPPSRQKRFISTMVDNKSQAFLGSNLRRKTNPTVECERSPQGQ